MPIQIETVKTEGFSMDFFRFGSGGKALVILPGLSVQSVMLSAEAVREAYAVMERDFTVYVFDRRRELPPAYPVSQMAEDTARALRALGLRDVCLFGASQGGMMAMCLSAAHPELVRRLALGSTAAEIRPAQRQIFANWVRLAEARDGVGLYLDFGEKLYPEELFRQYRDALTAAGKAVTREEFARFVTLARGTENFSVTDRLGRIGCPVLVIGDRTDAIFGPEGAAEIAAGLPSRPQNCLYLYDGYGHAAYDTAPDYKERLLKFFTEE